jgi:hypothetical protein
MVVTMVVRPIAKLREETCSLSLGNLSAFEPSICVRRAAATPVPDAGLDNRSPAHAFGFCEQREQG